MLEAVLQASSVANKTVDRLSQLLHAAQARNDERMPELPGAWML